MIEIAKVIISLFPIFLFLAALMALDSYKLVGLPSVLLTIFAGCLAAGISLVVNGWLFGLIGVSPSTYSRYLAPLVEELTKAFYLFALLRTHRIGFMVDAAIYGFAVGAGFSLVENIYYLLQVTSPNLLLWLIRGFGTAAVHASTMAMFGIFAKSLSDRSPKWGGTVFLPAFVVAVLTHSLYNHFLFSPVLTTVAMLVVLPLLVIIVFERSERATQEWLGLGFDTDQELLRILTTGEITRSKVGQYLQSLKARFPGSVVADMFCLLRIQTELALRAKGMLMLSQAGIKQPIDPEIEAKFDELHYLKKSIGRTGLLAILPFTQKSSRDLWQLHTVKKRQA